VLAIAQLDAYSSLKVPLELIHVVLGEDFLDRRGIVERTALRSRQFNSMAKAIAAGAEVGGWVAWWVGGWVGWGGLAESTDTTRHVGDRSLHTHPHKTLTDNCSCLGSELAGHAV
jgi:hypothetical protein